MNPTFKGLPEFPKERDLILEDVIELVELCQNDTSDLCDVIACLLITISSLKLKADTLIKVLEERRLEK